MNLTKITRIRVKLARILADHQDTLASELPPEIALLFECEECIEDMWEQIEELEQEIEGLV